GRPYTDSYGGETKACEEWRCLATATSCEDAASCRYLGYTERRVGCETGDAHCDGSIRTICSGGSFRHAFDCADVGATCVDGYCQVGDCRFGPFGIANCTSTMGPGIGLGCVVDTCEAECIPTGYGEVYYGYCGPRRDAPSVVCDGDGVLTIDMLRSEDLSYDCRAHGYSGCDHRGCTP
ncbi:MAG: hypothetical protein GWN84_06815, partial [Gammaproteobacteria bacterium]|nr:hypothetical protein [Gammaproteobacteria bacterium]NIR82612.1 hypothetical protein [Gammaproteobacteria bacterium]NIV51119.1 hypothetical protein [Gammaproteobacteria bacterium]